MILQQKALQTEILNFPLSILVTLSLLLVFLLLLPALSRDELLPLDVLFSRDLEGFTTFDLPLGLQALKLI